MGLFSKDKLRKKDAKHMAEAVSRQSGREVQSEIGELDRDDRIVYEYFKAENEVIKDFIDKIKAADQFLDKFDVDEYLKTDESDTFSRIKQIVEYIGSKTGDIIDLVGKTIDSEKRMREQFGHIDFKEGERLLDRITVDEEKVQKNAKRIHESATKFLNAVRELQGNEDDASPAHKKEVVERSLGVAFKAMNAMRKHANELVERYNDALKAAKEVTVKEIRAKAMVNEHLQLLKEGKIKQLGTPSEASRLYSQAKGNIDDPLYKGNRALLEKWSKEYDDMQLKKTG